MDRIWKREIEDKTLEELVAVQQRESQLNFDQELPRNPQSERPIAGDFSKETINDLIFREELRNHKKLPSFSQPQSDYDILTKIDPSLKNKLKKSVFMINKKKTEKCGSSETSKVSFMNDLCSSIRNSFSKRPKSKGNTDQRMCDSTTEGSKLTHPHRTKNEKKSNKNLKSFNSKTTKNSEKLISRQMQVKLDSTIKKKWKIARGREKKQNNRRIKKHRNLGLISFAKKSSPKKVCLNHLFTKFSKFDSNIYQSKKSSSKISMKKNKTDFMKKSSFFSKSKNHKIRKIGSCTPKQQSTKNLKFANNKFPKKSSLAKMESLAFKNSWKNFPEIKRTFTQSGLLEESPVFLSIREKYFSKTNHFFSKKKNSSNSIAKHSVKAKVSKKFGSLKKRFLNSTFTSHDKFKKEKTRKTTVKSKQQKRSTNIN